MRLLPIGIQDFADIRQRGFVYVDKTIRIHELITGSGKAFFLSRPRRFGKSLLCSTLGAVFENRRELFGEIAGFPALAINSLNWEWKKYPVIRLDFNAGVYNDVEGLNNVLLSELQLKARKLGISLEQAQQAPASQFKFLIQEACFTFGEKAVVIIDEYDKPLLESLDDPIAHEAIRKELKGFYGVLKQSDEYLRFVFLTGVSKFSQVSVFSDLNHLVDMTFDQRYADICGITQEELETCFAPEIAEIIKNTGRNREEYMNDIRNYYNGYRFSKKQQKVYNSFGLLNHFDKSGEFHPYWYETGTPTFLINLIKKQKIDITDISKEPVHYDEFNKYDAMSMKAVPVLYQTGYLTITDYDEEDNLLMLDYPNLEVRSSFSKSLLKQYLQAPEGPSISLIGSLPKALREGDIEAAVNLLKKYLAAVPYDIIRETENYYQTAVHLIFSMFGLNCRSEVRIASGRIDTLVETKNFVYCFEFKIEKTANLAEACNEALAQIDTKEYLLPWSGSGKKLFKVGVVFDTEKHNIGEWKHSEQ